MREKTAWKWRRKNRLETKEKWAKQNDEIQKTFVTVFAEYEYSEKTQKKTVKKCKKTKKCKLILSRKYLNWHRNKNSLTYHRRNTKNIFHGFSKQKHNRSTKRSDCSTFCQKYYAYAAKQLKITFRISLTLFKAFLKL